MKRSEMLKQIKAVFRANNSTMLDFQNGEISFGRMAEIMSKKILSHIEEKGMRAPEPDGDLAGILDDGDWEQE